MSEKYRKISQKELELFAETYLYARENVPYNDRKKYVIRRMQDEFPYFNNNRYDGCMTKAKNGGMITNDRKGKKKLHQQRVGVYEIIQTIKEKFSKEIKPEQLMKFSGNRTPLENAKEMNIEFEILYFIIRNMNKYDLACLLSERCKNEMFRICLDPKIKMLEGTKYSVEDKLKCIEVLLYFEEEIEKTKKRLVDLMVFGLNESLQDRYCEMNRNINAIRIIEYKWEQEKSHSGDKEFTLSYDQICKELGLSLQFVTQILGSESEKMI